MSTKTNSTNTIVKKDTDNEWDRNAISVLLDAAKHLQGSAATRQTIRTFRREVQEPHPKKVKVTSKDDDKATDPFLYFSSDKRRLEYLLGRELPHVPADGEKPEERKTRISFEVDPFYSLVTSFPELLGVEEISGDEDESLSESINDE